MSYDDWLEAPYQDAYAREAELTPIYEFWADRSVRLEGMPAQVIDVTVFDPEDIELKVETFDGSVAYVTPMQLDDY